MPHKDDTAPATKADLVKLRRELSERFEAIDECIKKEGEETRRHFDIVAENFRDEIIGAFSDRTAQFENPGMESRRRDDSWYCRGHPG